MRYVLDSKGPLRRLAVVLLFSMCFVGACAELDQLMKPRVEGMEQAADFDSEALIQGGFAEIHVVSTLADSSVNVNVLETIFITAIREKRQDVPIGQNGRYQITANLIANDVIQRTDNLEEHIYKWTKRRVKVNYVIIEKATGRQVWTGTIETNREDLASYDVKKNEKTSDKVIDLLAVAISSQDLYPYPSPPLLSDIAKLNFEGFALNLPMSK